MKSRNKVILGLVHNSLRVLEGLRVFSFPLGHLGPLAVVLKPVPSQTQEDNVSGHDP